MADLRRKATLARWRPLVVLPFALACACGPGAGPAPRSGRPLIVMIGSDPATFDPHVSYSDVSASVLGNIFESQVRFDAQLRVVPALAQRWINPDERTWRFKAVAR